MLGCGCVKPASQVDALFSRARASSFAYQGEAGVKPPIVVQVAAMAPDHPANTDGPDAGLSEIDRGV